MNIFETKKLNRDELADLQAREGYPFCIANNQIFFVEEKENGEAILQGVCEYFKVLKVIVEQETHTVKYRLLMYTKVGKREITVDKSVFIGHIVK